MLVIVAVVVTVSPMKTGAVNLFDKLVAEDSRDKCSAQHSVSDAAAKTRGLGKFFIEMYRVKVA
jgi:hypothetical protein